MNILFYRKAGVVVAVGMGLLLLFGVSVRLASHFILLPKSADALFRPRGMMAFSYDGWKSRPFGDPIRYKMANGIVWSGALHGLSRGQVAAELGESGKEHYHNGERILTYELCSQTSIPASSIFLSKGAFLNIDAWELEIYFKDGKVLRAAIEAH